MVLHYGWAYCVLDRNCSGSRDVFDNTCCLFLWNSDNLDFFENEIAFHDRVYLSLASPRLWPFYPHPYGGYLLPTCNFKRKGGQVRFTPQQTTSLERRFNNHKYLSPEDRKHLALQLKLSDRQVQLHIIYMIPFLPYWSLLFQTKFVSKTVAFFIFDTPILTDKIVNHNSFEI